MLATLEVMIVALCWWRNGKEDRRNGIACSPLVVLEALQSWLSRIVARERTSSSRWICGPLNRGVSCGVALVIHGVPFALTLRASARLKALASVERREAAVERRSEDLEAEVASPLRRSAAVVEVATAMTTRWFWLLGCGTATLMLADIMPSCTVLRQGRQRWAALLFSPEAPSYAKKAFRRGLCLAYCAHLLVPLRASPTHDLVDIVLALFALATALACFSTRGAPECFRLAAAALCLAMLPAPYLSWKGKQHMRPKKKTRVRWSDQQQSVLSEAHKEEEPQEQPLLVVDSWPAPQRDMNNPPPGVVVVPGNDRRLEDDAGRHQRLTSSPTILSSRRPTTNYNGEEQKHPLF